MSEITGNKGEWSEFYALVKLLALGILYAADEDIKPLKNIYFPIKKIFKSEDNNNIEYTIKNTESIDIFFNDNFMGNLQQTKLKEYAKLLLDKIKAGGNSGAFKISHAEEIMNDLHCSKIKEPGAKVDISMLLHDIHTGFEPVCGFSIKSELGHPPTLLNASNATNFRYEVKNISPDDVVQINKFKDKNKIIERIKQIYDRGGELVFDGIVNTCFENNLTMIDSKMDQILSYLMLYSYKNNVLSCEELVDIAEFENPLNISKKGFYAYKIKKFLCAVALGLKPSEDWLGQDEANGGYIIVTSEGNVLAYHIYNRDSFENYLLKNTKLERASTSRHNYASIYLQGNTYYMNLNLQIRFK